MQAGHKNTYDCIEVFSETNLTEDLLKIDVPTLVIHGDDDQSCPSPPRALARPGSSGASFRKIYGHAHRLADTRKAQLQIGA